MREVPISHTKVIVLLAMLFVIISTISPPVKSDENPAISDDDPPITQNAYQYTGTGPWVEWWYIKITDPTPSFETLLFDTNFEGDIDGIDLRVGREQEALKLYLLGSNLTDDSDDIMIFHTELDPIYTNKHVGLKSYNSTTYFDNIEIETSSGNYSENFESYNNGDDPVDWVTTGDNCEIATNQSQKVYGFNYDGIYTSILNETYSTCYNYTININGAGGGNDPGAGFVIDFTNSQNYCELIVYGDSRIEFKKVVNGNIQKYEEKKISPRHFFIVYCIDNDDAYVYFGKVCQDLNEKIWVMDVYEDPANDFWGSSAKCELYIDQDLSQPYSNVKNYMKNSDQTGDKVELGGHIQPTVTGDSQIIHGYEGKTEFPSLSLSKKPFTLSSQESISWNLELEQLTGWYRPNMEINNPAFNWAVYMLDADLTVGDGMKIIFKDETYTVRDDWYGYQDRNFGSKYPIDWYWGTGRGEDSGTNWRLITGGGTPFDAAERVGLVALQYGNDFIDFAFDEGDDIDVEFSNWDYYSNEFGTWKVPLEWTIIAEDTTSSTSQGGIQTIDNKIEITITASLETYELLLFPDTLTDGYFNDFEPLDASMSIKLYEKTHGTSGWNQIATLYDDHAGVEYGTQDIGNKVWPMHNNNALSNGHSEGPWVECNLDSSQSYSDYIDNSGCVFVDELGFIGTSVETSSQNKPALVCFSKETSLMKCKYELEDYSYNINTVPVVADGTVYFGSKNYLYAIDLLETSPGQYSFSFDWTYDFPPNVNIYSSPIYKAGKIYLGTDDGIIYCINRDGTKSWDYNSEDSIVISPVIHNGMLFIGTESGATGSFLALDKTDGSILWEKDISTGHSITSIALTEYRVIIGIASSYGVTGEVRCYTYMGHLKWLYSPGAIHGIAIDENNVFVRWWDTEDEYEGDFLLSNLDQFGIDNGQQGTSCSYYVDKLWETTLPTDDWEYINNYHGMNVVTSGNGYVYTEAPYDVEGTQKTILCYDENGIKQWEKKIIAYTNIEFPNPISISQGQLWVPTYYGYVYKIGKANYGVTSGSIENRSYVLVNNYDVTMTYNVSISSNVPTGWSYGFGECGIYNISITLEQFNFENDEGFTEFYLEVQPNTYAISGESAPQPGESIDIIIEIDPTTPGYDSWIINTTYSVEQEYDIDLSCIMDSKTIDPGQEVEFEIEIENNGNGEDYVDLYIAFGNIPDWWSASLNNVSINLSRYDTATTTLTIGTPWNATSGYYNIEIIATSLGRYNPVSISTNTTIT